ncbi:hypothetical protein TNCV_4647561 [Trichonephila clavipes]|uniref:Uncharacterized protein n=1 Tax=Trichonephila clavipes TaxID=2585209 RepID=A0A8X6VRS7_TRICX|nr:hypothetical protein TNCV_4647561 [Trichonephila clavipes]
MMWFVRKEFFSVYTQFEDSSISRSPSLSSLATGISSLRLFRIYLHPASSFEPLLHSQPFDITRDMSKGCGGSAIEGTRNNFRDTGAECTCDDYFHKEAESQLGGGKRYKP